MRWTILILLLLLWLLGIIGGDGGGFIHLVLAISVMFLIFNIVTGRRGVQT